MTQNRVLESLGRRPRLRPTGMLKRFKFAAMRHKRNSRYQFWTHENHAIELESYKFIMQKMAYIHDNP